MVQYEYFPSDPELGKRRSAELTDTAAARSVGERVLIGFNVVQRHVVGPSGACTQITYFQSDISGNVWALYH